MADAQSPKANSADSLIDGESQKLKGVATQKLKSTEARYIELLEEKIARLEAEAKLSRPEGAGDTAKESKDKSSDDAKTNSTSDRDSEKGKADGEAEKIKRSRVRYIERKLDDFGEHDDTDVDGFNDVEDKSTTKRSTGETDSGKKGEEESYAIAWRRTASKAPGDKGTRQLLIESTPLREALKSVMGNARFSFDVGEVIFMHPYDEIYHKMDELREHAKTSDERTKTDIETLLSEVSQQLATELKDIKSLEQNGQITFELLWSLFHPGCLVRHKVMDGIDEAQISVVGRANETYFDNATRYELVLWGVDYDGEDFTFSEVYRRIDKFKGPKAFTDLEVCPLDKWIESEGKISLNELKEKLVQRGEKFEKLCNEPMVKKYKRYGGIVVHEGAIEMAAETEDAGDSGSMSGLAGKMKPKAKNGVEKWDDKTAVMIDHYSYLKLYKKGSKLGRLGKYELDEVCICQSCRTLLNESLGDLSKTKDGNRTSSLSERQRLVCPPRIFGFDVRQKLWAQLLVEPVREIDQEDKGQAFKKLVLASKTKELLKTLVLEHAKNQSPLDDLIPGKGNGLIVLLHGPPGVGKTLTAESLAMLSGKPLYSVTISEIGTSPAVVEQNLIRIFELATHWNAILLFDEADVFLEKRSLKDLRRNSLVSTLLRILEYFSGILFLTSNRVKTFDEAFQSRIHLAVRYNELEEANRRSIWKIWLDKAGDMIEPSEKERFEDELEEGGDLAKVKLNGRQIRNCFRSGMAVANARNLGERKLKVADVSTMVTKTGELLSYMVQNEQMAAARFER